MSIHKPKMTNACIRCARKDNIEQSLFKLSDAKLEQEGVRLWVWDMIYSRERSWDDDMDNLCNHIEKNREILSLLKEGSYDFTLHLAVGLSKFSYPFLIPHQLTCLSSECGFDIEIYVDQ